MATLLEGLKSKSVSNERIHKAYVNEQQGQWMKASKPDGTIYGLLIDQFVKRVDLGEIIIKNEDVKLGVIEFTYKGSSSPFK